MKKLVNKKGFTLMEMLIVVAIIGILVAITVPTFSNSLDKAYTATDGANLRSAKSLYATMKADPDQETPGEGAIYDMETGTFTGTSADVGECSAHSKCYIRVNKDGQVSWYDGSKDVDPCN